MEYSKPSDSYCHSGSVENYFASPKMPVKDHYFGLRSTVSSFKPQKHLIDNNVKKVLGQNETVSSHVDQILKIKEMKLMNQKQLYIATHKSGKENSNVNSHHDRQTNPGYSRNKFGGFFTS